MSSESVLDVISNMPTRPSRDLDHLPGDYGLPVFGHTFDIVKDAAKQSKFMQEKYGDIYRTSVFFNRHVSICDASHVQEILMDKEQNFSSSKGWFMLSSLLRKGILLRDFSDHRIHRRPLQQAFKSPVMNAYADQLNVLLKEGVDAWPLNQEFYFQPAIKSLLLNNAASIFLGSELEEESDKLNKAFVDILEALLSIIRLPYVGKWKRGLQGSKYIRTWLADRIDERLKSDSNDFFTSFCQAAKDPENDLSVEDIVDHTLILLFAAHDTTNSTLSMMMSLLGEHPQWQDKMREEIQAIDGDTLTFSQLDQLDVVDRFFRETLRMYPAVMVIPRRAIKAVEMGGHHIPPNTNLQLQVRSIHYSEKYWTNPYQFDPDRWLPERSEHKQHAFQWIPFGGGAHKCLGFRFAEMQTKIFLFQLLRHYKVESRPNRSAAVRSVPIPLPKDRLPVTMTKLP